jgi:hypothetical protein
LATTHKKPSDHVKIATSYHYQTNRLKKHCIRTIRQSLDNFTNSRGTNWVIQLSYVQLTINAPLDNSTGSSPFEIIYDWNVCPLPAVKISPTNVPSADEQHTSLMKVQQEAHKVLELTRACQTRVSRDCLKPAIPLIPGKDTVLVRTVPYLKVLKKKTKIISPWIETFPVLEGPDDNNN